MRKKIIGLIALLLVTAASAAKEDITSMQVNDEEVRRWSVFADNLYRLHQQQIAGRSIRETERTGGYAGLPDFYREVSYCAASNRLLSRIQWERAHPGRIHTIEVYVYDESSRVARDYMAWYLPDARNAPRQTTINLHHYEGGLHGWRQFDASGNRIYEKCTHLPEEKLVFELSGEDRIGQAEEDRRSVVYTGDYRRCFDKLEKTTGRYLTPQ